MFKNYFEGDSSNLGQLLPGKVILSDVPIFKNTVEIGAPKKRPIFNLDIAVETGLVEIRRSDGELFNVAHYRTPEGSKGTVEPHVMFGSLVPAVLLWQDRFDQWKLDGHGIELIDFKTAQHFIEKVAEVAVNNQTANNL